MQWREDFITTFLERDLLQWTGFSLHTMRRLWQILAYNNGQTITYSAFGNSLGVSHTTIRNYIDLLAETFMVNIVPPFFSHSGKRLVKAPKVYLRDSGIANALLGIGTFTELTGHPSFGAVLESVVLNYFKALYPGATVSFYRTSHGAEIDFVPEYRGKKIVAECKATLSPRLTKGTYEI